MLTACLNPPGSIVIGLPASWRARWRASPKSIHVPRRFTRVLVGRSSRACRCPGWSSGPGRSRRTSSPPRAPISAASTATTMSTSASATRARWPAMDQARRSRPSSARCAAGSPTCSRPTTRRGSARSSRDASASGRGSSRCRRPTPTAGCSGSPGTSPGGRGSSSTTTAITARSTRRSRCSDRTARSFPFAARSAHRSTSRGRRSSSSSTTPRGSRPPWPTATSPLCCSSLP